MSVCVSVRVCVCVCVCVCVRSVRGAERTRETPVAHEPSDGRTYPHAHVDRRAFSRRRTCARAHKHAQTQKHACADELCLSYLGEKSAGAQRVASVTRKRLAP